MEKFSLHKFFIKATSRKLWIWILSSYFIHKILILNGDKDYFIYLIIGWIIISVMYFLHDSINELLKMIINKMDIKIGINNER